MKLTKENIEYWKVSLNDLAREHFGDNFSETQTDEDWLNDSLGLTPQEVVDDNLLDD